jgi:hypothetical protein
MDLAGWMGHSQASQVHHHVPINHRNTPGWSSRGSRIGLRCPSEVKGSDDWLGDVQDLVEGGWEQMENWWGHYRSPHRWPSTRSSSKSLNPFHDPYRPRPETSLGQKLWGYQGYRRGQDRGIIWWRSCKRVRFWRIFSVGSYRVATRSPSSLVWRITNYQQWGRIAIAGGSYGVPSKKLKRIGCTFWDISIRRLRAHYRLL